MNREELIEFLNQQEPTFLTRAPKDINRSATYICPACGNGSGKDGTGISLIPNSENGKRYKCFKCLINEDIIGWWMKDRNTDFIQAVSELCEYYGIETQIKPIEDKQMYLRKCADEVYKTDFYSKRGLSGETVRKYKLGFDDSFKIDGGMWCAAIIPTGGESYVARNTDPNSTDRYRKRGASQVYLKDMLWDSSKPVYVVEGELDALSIIEVGGNAVGLGSTSNYKQLLKLLDNNKPTQPLIIALDNDEEGERTANILAAELEKRYISFYRLNPYGEEHDANAALIANREEFTRVINTDLAVEEYTKTSAAFYLQEFINGIAESVNTPYIPTGFEKVDKVLDGGLYEGLYILGAISSLGKTTLALQIADQIAEGGQEVLIFSLEMARNELMAKSISRLTLIHNTGSIQDSKTSRGITTGSRYGHYSETEKNLIKKAISAYEVYAKNIYIHEGVGDIGTTQIRETVKKHIAITEKKPVVLIDYIQILAPVDIRATDKQNTDRAVLELKRISRDFKIPVIGISSVNRASYNSPATMEMLKESGSIEYGSDCVLGLQLKGVGNKDFDVNTAKNKNPRLVEMVILKNRNGATGGKLDFEYYPMFNYFKEV